jgi:hypothetical protein
MRGAFRDHRDGVLFRGEGGSGKGQEGGEKYGELHPVLLRRPSTAGKPDGTTAKFKAQGSKFKKAPVSKPQETPAAGCWKPRKLGHWSLALTLKFELRPAALPESGRLCVSARCGGGLNAQPPTSNIQHPKPWQKELAVKAAARIFRTPQTDIPE